VVRVEPPGIPGLEESLQPAVFEPDDHPTSVTCNGSLVKLPSSMGCSVPLLTFSSRLVGRR
jgi:hypothetical protein